MGPPERLNLRWDDFEANARLSFRKFRDEREFFDVTVVADCGEQVEANKVVLAGGSSFFHRILKENPHPHPLIYLKGVGYQHLVYLLNFVYTGETSIEEDDLNDFLDIAHDLQVKGLTRHGTLETRGNQTTSRASPLNQEAAKEPKQEAAKEPLNQEAAKEPCPSPWVSHPHCVTSAVPAPDHDQVAAQEHGPSLRMLRQSRGQSITSTCPTPHPSQVVAQEVPPPALSHLHNVKCALPQGQVAAHKTVLSPSIFNQVQVAANKIVLSPHRANSAFPQGQVAAKETAPSSSRSDPHIPKSVLPQGKLIPSLGIQSLRSAISSHLNNASSQSSCEENHENTFNVKVEVGEGEHYNVVCGTNVCGEQYICHVSSKALEENGGNINVDEGIVLSAEQEQNDHGMSIGKEPKEEIIESADVVFGDEQMPHDWYEHGEEIENKMLGRNKDDKNNMIPDREQDLEDKTKSSEDTNFQCFLCSIIFTTSSQLRRHMKSHMMEKQVPRPVRSKMSSLMGSSSKQNRIDAEEEQGKSYHTGDQPHQRLLSSKKISLRKKIKLNQHKMTHTEEKTYQCAHCSKSFSQLCSLKRHQLIHTGEKPFQCALCSKSFNLLGNLKRHELIHTGEKPFQCALCSKSFSQLGNLKQHELIHTGEKPFQCALCSKSFSHVSNLKQHKVTHASM